MSKLTRDNAELVYTNPGALRAEDIPFDAASSIQQVIAILQPFVDTFVDADLTAGVLTVTHSKNRKGVIVKILDSSGYYIEPDYVKYVDDDTVDINLTPQGTLTGTWTVVVK